MKRILTIILILLSSAAFADDKLPTVDSIPSFLSEADKTAFGEKADVINEQLNAVVAAAGAFNSKTAEVQTDEEFETVSKMRSNYIEAVSAYNDALAIAAKAAKTEQDEVIIPVSLFSMPDDAAFCERQIKMLNKQMSFLSKERNKLKAIETGTRELVVENVTASLDLMQDTQSQSLSLLTAMVSILEIPDSAKDLLGIELGGIQINLNNRAALSTKDKTRSNEKMMDASADLKNLVLTKSKMLSPVEAEAIKSATDGVIKVFKIIVRHQTVDPKEINLHDDLEDSVNASLDVIQAVEPTIGVILKTTTGFPIMTKAAWALGHLENDRAEIERALHQNATALSYYDNRIAKVADDISIYEERLKHQPSKTVK